LQELNTRAAVGCWFLRILVWLYAKLFNIFFTLLSNFDFARSRQSCFVGFYALTTEVEEACIVFQTILEHFFPESQLINYFLKSPLPGLFFDNTTLVKRFLNSHPLMKSLSLFWYLTEKTDKSYFWNIHLKGPFLSVCYTLKVEIFSWWLWTSINFVPM